MDTLYLVRTVARRIDQRTRFAFAGPIVEGKRSTLPNEIDPQVAVAGLHRAIRRLVPNNASSIIPKTRTISVKSTASLLISAACVHVGTQPATRVSWNWSKRHCEALSRVLGYWLDELSGNGVNARDVNTIRAIIESVVDDANGRFRDAYTRWGAYMSDFRNVLFLANSLSKLPDDEARVRLMAEIVPQPTPPTKKELAKLLKTSRSARS